MHSFQEKVLLNLGFDGCIRVCQVDRQESEHSRERLHMQREEAWNRCYKSLN
jgi:type VI protein secretion system component VasF